MTNQAKRRGVIQCSTCICPHVFRDQILFIQPIGYNDTIANATNWLITNTLRGALVTDMYTSVPEIMPTQKIMPGCFSFQGFINFVYI
ncbi:hypothetical protein AO391_24950 [Pseudomonas marginalis ICMP 9505]|nr:hypothetical protein AO391_24950 [Pseudomonas marginalis ICMP 9505]